MAVQVKECVYEEGAQIDAGSGDEIDAGHGNHTEEANSNDSHDTKAEDDMHVVDVAAHRLECDCDMDWIRTCRNWKREAWFDVHGS
jgi:hypothetical protein